jgi:type IV secretory pathway TrbD component
MTGWLQTVRSTVSKTSASFGKKRALVVVEIVAAASVLHGIGMWSIPSAFIVGGLAVIVSIEFRTWLER